MAQKKTKKAIKRIVKKTETRKVMVQHMIMPGEPVVSRQKVVTVY